MNSPYRSTEQSDYATRLSTFLAGDATHPLLLHGAAGLGKTRAFLIPVTQYSVKHRVLIATATVQLARQLIDSSDLAIALGLTSKPITVERYIAARQFASPTRVAALAARSGMTIDCGPADLVDEVLDRIDPERERLSAADICLTRRCPRKEFEPYQQQKERCAKADIVVTTHAALILDRRTGGKLIDLASFDAVLVDEADRLPAAASLQLDALIAWDDLTALAVKRESNLASMLTKIIAEIGLRLGAAHNDADADLLLELRADAREALDAISQPHGQVVAETSRGIELRVRSPARVLSKWANETPRLIFTSGTLAVEKDFTDFVRCLGLKAWEEAYIEPKRHGKLSFVLARRDMPKPRRDDGEFNSSWLDYLIDGIKTAQEAGSKVLVLTTSFELASTIANRLPACVAHQRGESLADALRRFTRGVFVSPAAWEGVDLGIEWSDIVIPTIPYPPRDEVIDTPFLSLQDCAMRRLAQGIARGTRTPEQHCTIWLLDPRFPLPGALVNNPSARVSQGKAAHHLRLACAIPLRFRSGFGPAFDKAEIFHANTNNR